MSQRGMMQGAMRQVPSLMGESLTVRTRTSVVGATITWSADVPITGQFAQAQEEISPDPARAGDTRRTMAVIIYADTYTFPLQGSATSNELPIGAEIKRSDGAYWAVVKRLPATAGLFRALVQRDMTRQLKANRGGGVI